MQVDYSKRRTWGYDPRFGDANMLDTPDLFLNLSDLDGSSYSDDASQFGQRAFATLRGYKNLTMVSEERDDGAGGTITVNVPTYTNQYRDGQGPNSTEVVSSLVALPGHGFNGWNTSNNSQFRFTGSARRSWDCISLSSAPSTRRVRSAAGASAVGFPATSTMPPVRSPSRRTIRT